MFPNFSEAEIQFEPNSVPKLGACYSYRILFSHDERIRVVPVNYLKLNGPDHQITAAYANFAVRGSVSFPDEEEILRERISKHVGTGNREWPDADELNDRVRLVLGLES